jgi:ankyrin repeat protein
MRFLSYVATIATLLLSLGAFAAPLFADSPDTARITEAMNKRDHKTVMDLIQKGQGINGYDKDGNTPLSMACRLGDADLAKKLIESGAKIDQRVPGELTPLMIAAGATHLEVVKLLVEKGAKIDLATGYNHTALRFACDAQAPEIAQYLAKKGANPRALGADNKIAGGCLPRP